MVWISILLLWVKMLIDWYASDKDHKSLKLKTWIMDVHLLFFSEEKLNKWTFAFSQKIICSSFRVSEVRQKVRNGATFSLYFHVSLYSSFRVYKQLFFVGIIIIPSLRMQQNLLQALFLLFLFLAYLRRKLFLLLFYGFGFCLSWLDGLKKKACWDLSSHLSFVSLLGNVLSGI